MLWLGSLLLAWAVCSDAQRASFVALPKVALLEMASVFFASKFIQVAASARMLSTSRGVAVGT
eukprot:3015448-Prorocentrum_lima.AAC.1